MFLSVIEVLLCNGTDQGVTRVTVSQQRADGQKHFGNGQCWAPVVLQDVQADGALAVDVAVVNARAKHHLGL